MAFGSSGLEPPSRLRAKARSDSSGPIGRAVMPNTQVFRLASTAVLRAQSAQNTPSIRSALALNGRPVTCSNTT